jgi:hypothetical protein
VDDWQLERLVAEADPEMTGRIPRLRFLSLLRMMLQPPPRPPAASSHLPIFSRQRSATRSLDASK